MYYLVIKNMGVQKCIDKNPVDIYVSGQYYKCGNDFKFLKDQFVRRIWIRCTELPGTRFLATIYQSVEKVNPTDSESSDNISGNI